MSVLHIEVTPRHINEGIPDDGACCALAEAFIEAGVYSVFVGIPTVEGAFHGVDFEIYLLRVAVDFARDLDDGEQVQPIAFDIEIPEEA